MLEVKSVKECTIEVIRPDELQVEDLILYGDKLAKVNQIFFEYLRPNKHVVVTILDNCFEVELKINMFPHFYRVKDFELKSHTIKQEEYYDDPTYSR